MPTTPVLCHYHYDPLDRLTACAQPDALQAQRFYLKNRQTTEIEGLVRRSIFQHADVLLAEQRHTGQGADTSLLATDQQRSVLQVANTQGVAPLVHTPYGHRTGESGLLSLLGFNGERPDPVTGYYLLGNGYRAFNPVLMRFHSPDSLSPFGRGGFNTYGYCLGDPVNNMDPSGHFTIASQLAKGIFQGRPARGAIGGSAVSRVVSHVDSPTNGGLLSRGNSGGAYGLNGEVGLLDVAGAVPKFQSGTEVVEYNLSNYYDRVGKKHLKRKLREELMEQSWQQELMKNQVEQNKLKKYLSTRREELMPEPGYVPGTTLERRVKIQSKIDKLSELDRESRSLRAVISTAVPLYRAKTKLAEKWIRRG